MIWVLLSLVFVAIAGASDGFQTAIKDNPREKTIMGAWIIKRYTEDSKWWRWYNGWGGNAEWNPSLPSLPFWNIWYADAWHTWKFGILYGWGIALGCASMAQLNLWQAALLAIVAQAVAGTVFRMFYSHVCIVGAEPWWTVFADMNPFTNKRKSV